MTVFSNAHPGMDSSSFMRPKQYVYIIADAQTEFKTRCPDAMVIMSSNVSVTIISVLTRALLPTGTGLCQLAVAVIRFPMNMGCMIGQKKAHTE
jgi:hypothetical protein